MLLLFYMAARLCAHFLGLKEMRPGEVSAEGVRFILRMAGNMGLVVDLPSVSLLRLTFHSSWSGFSGCLTVVLYSGL